MLKVLYIFGGGYELVTIILDCIGIIATVKQEKKTHNIGLCLIIWFLAIILIVSVASGVIHYFYTETPDIIGDTLYEAHHSLHDSKLVLDDAIERIFEDNLRASNLLVQTQEPGSGEIVPKKSVITVTIKDITDSHDIINEPPIQNPDDTDTSSISTPTQDTITPTTSTPSASKPTIPTPSTSKPTSNSTPNNSTSTGTESGTDTGDYQPVEPPISDYDTNNPYTDPAFNGNASVCGDVNADVGPGDYQPEVP